MRRGDSAKTSGGKVCARVENGCVSQMTEGELCEKYPNFTDNCRVEPLGKGNHANPTVPR